MNRKLVDKYFNDQCSPKELECVLHWFQTDEGRRFLKEDIKLENRKFDETGDPNLATGIESEKVFDQIHKHKREEIKQLSVLKPIHRQWYITRVASIIFFAVVLSIGLYLGGVTVPGEKRPVNVPAFMKYATAAGQQKVFKLSNGIKIWLNENSELTVPTHFTKNRTVTLKGEAYFEVVHNADHPFVINAGGAVIKDLGTKFNVRTDSAANAVQVAVVEGKIKLKKNGDLHQTSAILTRNHFGMLDLSNGQITIEKGNVKNYLSWKTNQFVFHGEPLAKISRQLQRLYNVKIRFHSDQLKGIHLTANFERTKLKTALKLIAHTLDIHFKINGGQVVWMN